MEPLTFIYSFTIEGYNVTITIEFFPHIIVLEDSSSELTDDEFPLTCEIINSWTFILSCYTLPLGYFTIGLVYYRNIFIVGLFLAICF